MTTSSRINVTSSRYDHEGNFRQHIGQVQTFLQWWLELPQQPNEDDGDYFWMWKENFHCKLTMDFTLNNLSGELKQHIKTVTQEPWKR